MIPFNVTIDLTTLKKYINIKVNPIFTGLPGNVLFWVVQNCTPTITQK